MKESILSSPFCSDALYRSVSIIVLSEDFFLFSLFFVLCSFFLFLFFSEQQVGVGRKDM